MPASNTRALAKGPSLNADAIVIDLEDSVAPNAKAQARINALAALGQNYGHRLRVLRVNDVDSDFFADDIALLKQAQPDAVLLPKVESAQTIIEVDRILSAFNDSVKLWAMLETTKAVVNANSIAQSTEQCPRFTTVCIGNNDLAREAGMQVGSDRNLLIPWLMQLLLAAKAYGLDILDGVYNNFKDIEGFHLECEQGAAMGMSGKTLIHPSQIDGANKAYSPSAADIAQAQQIVDAFALPEHAGLGVLQINGRMVERLHLDMALHTLDIAERIKASS